MTRIQLTATLRRRLHHNHFMALFVRVILPESSPYESPPSIASEDENKPADQPAHSSAILVGAIASIAAAVLYTGANIALRDAVGIDPFLVSAVKAAPTVILLAPYLIWKLLTKQSLLTRYRMIPWFALVALFGQFVGNAGFQVALDIIGLAPSVPLTLGMILVGGATLGRLLLGERITTSAVISIMIMLAAVSVLSLPDESRRPAESVSSMPGWVGALCAMGAGIAYALFGVVMRRTMHDGVSMTLTMFISGFVGFVSLWLFTALTMGLEGLREIQPDEWNVMCFAGIMNFMAFIALTLALKLVPVNTVNLVNASQVAMALIAGVVFFTEPITGPLIAGVVLTIVGLLVLYLGSPASKRGLADKVQ
ncbi:MAG: DMT family transporter [Planctomycetota bacterium]